MHDRRLEAISAAAELGSFSRAAAKLRVSTPALVKQVSGFEAEFGITLFERSHSGVKVTPAGALLVDDARSIMRQSEDALRRARRAAGDGGAVRLGVSMMCPGRQTLSMWTGVHELEPSLRFEIVPVSDLYDERESVMRSLGREVDVVQSSFSTPRWGDVCQKLRIVNVPFYIDVPRTSPLARKTRITVADLEGMRLRVLRHGNDAMDSLRIDLLADGGVDVIDVDSFDFALFNEAEEKGDAVLTCGAWSGVHPAFVGVPFLCGREVDVVQSSFSTPRWGDACQKLRIVNVPFYIDLPRTSPLARKTRITVADLEGMRLRVLRHGNDAMDSLRIDLLADGGVDVIDVDSFDFALFNEAEEKGDAVLTCGAWSGVHPAFVGVPFLCGREVPVFLHYPLEPTLQVQKFVNAMAQLLK